MDVRIVSVQDVGGDVLEVRGAVTVEGIVHELYAEGWVSATQRHYDASCYHAKDVTRWVNATTLQECLADEPDAVEVFVQQAGELRDDAVARPMTPAEVSAYALSLLPVPIVPTEIAWKDS